MTHNDDDDDDNVDEIL